MPTEDTDAETEAETAEDGDKGKDNEGLKRALQAERKAAADARKALKALQDEVATLKDRDKSDGEKLTDRVTQAEARAAKAEAKAAKLTVGMEKGLTLRQAMRLQGDTEEELTADADDLLETFGGKGKDTSKDSGDKSETDEAGSKDDGERRPPSRRPTEDLSGGGDPTNPPEDMDPAKLAKFIPRP